MVVATVSLLMVGVLGTILIVAEISYQFPSSDQADHQYISSNGRGDREYSRGDIDGGHGDAAADQSTKGARNTSL